MQPDRRKHVRILTIPNFGRALLVLLVVIAAADVISEMRGPRHGEYGRLTITGDPLIAKHPEAVTEAEVPDEMPSGPPTSLVTVPPAPQPPVQVQAQAPMRASMSYAGEAAGAPQSHAAVSDHVTIVGGADGIHVETARRDATPKLSGGIFRH
jgi:hypothetical protein